MDHHQVDILCENGVDKVNKFDVRMKELQELIRSYITPVAQVFRSFVDPPFNMENSSSLFDSESETEEAGTAESLNKMNISTNRKNVERIISEYIDEEPGTSDINKSRQTKRQSSQKSIPNAKKQKKNDTSAKATETDISHINKLDNPDPNNQEFNEIAKKLVYSIASFKKKDKTVEEATSSNDCQDEISHLINEAVNMFSKKISDAYKKAVEEKYKKNIVSTGNSHFDKDELDRIGKTVIDSMKRAVYQIVKRSMGKFERGAVRERLRLERATAAQKKIKQLLLERKKEIELVKAELATWEAFSQEFEQERNEFQQNTIRDI